MTIDQKISYLAYSKIIIKIVGESTMNLSDCAKLLTALKMMQELAVPEKETK